MTPASAPAGTPATTAVDMLEALGTELGALGLAARLHIQAGAVPVLHVTSPAGAALAEDIRAAPADRAWHYWWSWGEAVPAGTVPEAAALISRVLRPAAP